MKKLILPMALLGLSLNIFAAEELEPIADGPPQILAENEPVIPDAPVNAASQNSSNRLSTQIEETRRRGTGINEIRVQYKELPAYQLRREIGDRDGERSKSDLESDTSIPQWQLGSW